ncbi:MAG: long-chain-fatty-acid--CoA ligase [Deltaproteobacteria bacterium]|nr:MAG: long-chain-fatty-acid--CoA ligase [Deltaproteobacteria bacterium]
MIIGETLKKTAQEYGEKAAVIWGEKKLSFSELYERMNRLSHGMKDLGIKQGDRVALILPNSIQFEESYLATVNLGGIAMPIDVRTKAQELRDILSDAGTAALITTNQFTQLVEEAGKGLDFLKNIIVSGYEGDKFVSYEKLVEQGTPEEMEVDIKGDDEALYLYTSGTTGRPKGVVLTFDQLDLFPETINKVLDIAGEDVNGILLPMSHISGPIYCNISIVYGMTMVIFEQLSPDSILGAIEKHGVTWTHGVPPIFSMILKSPNIKKFDTSSLRIAAMMGMTVPPELMKAFQENFPHTKMIQGYGLTETSPLLTLTYLKDADRKMSSIGKAVPRAEVAIMDEKGALLPVGEVGEIVAKGPQIMKGYHNQPEMTAEIIRDGWFHTGDIGKCDEDGYFYHMGRKDDMIITGGLNVYPAEVENLLAQHPAVGEVAVVGVPDEKRGAVIKAVVVLKKGAEAGEKDLIKYCREKLTNYKVPQMVEFRDSLPRTGTGKVQKTELTK